MPYRTTGADCKNRKEHTNTKVWTFSIKTWQHIHKPLGFEWWGLPWRWTRFPIEICSFHADISLRALSVTRIAEVLLGRRPNPSTSLAVAIQTRTLTFRGEKIIALSFAALFPPKIRWRQRELRTLNTSTYHIWSHISVQGFRKS
jgi:hypothetical protein